MKNVERRDGSDVAGAEHERDLAVPLGTKLRRPANDFIGRHEPIEPDLRFLPRKQDPLRSVAGKCEDPRPAVFHPYCSGLEGPLPPNGPLELQYVSKDDGRALESRLSG